MISDQAMGDLFTAYLSDACDGEILAKDEETRLFDRLDRVWPERLKSKKHDAPPPEAQEIMAKIMRHNYRLVVSIAIKNKSPGLELVDMVSYANIYGLWRGIAKFDQTRGLKLSTYLVYWIKQAIGRIVIEQSTTIRRPAHAWERAKKIRDTEDQLLSNGQPITDANIAAHTRFGRVELTPEKVRESRRLSAQSITEEFSCIFAPDEIDDNSYMGSGLPTPEQATIEHGLTACFEHALAALTPREEKVIRLRYGLDDGYPLILGEIGKKMDITRERVRQIEAEALGKLRDYIMTHDGAAMREYLIDVGLSLEGEL